MSPLALLVGEVLVLTDDAVKSSIGGVVRSIVPFIAIYFQIFEIQRIDGTQRAV